MILILGLVLAVVPDTKPDRLDFQFMISPAYEAFAQKGDALCKARKLRYLHPANLEDMEENYLTSLDRHDRHRIKSFNTGFKGCPQMGASCPAQHTLAAIEKSDLLDGFVQFACTAGI